MARILAHAHSTWSHDGVLTLAEWNELARSLSCDAILLSEHEETGWDRQRYREYVDACASASSVDVQLIPGIEFNQDGFHVLSYGVEWLPDRPSPASALADAVHAQGRLLCLAHPGKYRWRHPSELVDVVDAVEVWNSKWIYDGHLGPHPRSWQMARGKLAFAGQDVHQRKHLTPLYVETASREVLRDLSEGAYRFVYAGRSWSPEDLRRKSHVGLAQRFRTQVLHPALSLYRFTRPLRQRIATVRTVQKVNQ